ncbi:hypothetical protein ACFWDN_21410 [Micromonospora chalcea]
MLSKTAAIAKVIRQARTIAAYSAEYAERRAEAGRAIDSFERMLKHFRAEQQMTTVAALNAGATVDELIAALESRGLR